ncbi:MAG: hypothetical protein ACR2OZ_12460 [Verrucomicrobiales bacterium]
MEPPCPFLPVPPRLLSAASLRDVGEERGELFYHRALECAQSLWLQGLPAQSLLLINRALSAELGGGEPLLSAWPLPYRAVAWVMRSRREEQFIGNPRRHYQHLATRMNAPRRELRRWRAWACWHLARMIFPTFPADEKQLLEENVVEPGSEEIASQLHQLGLPGEVDLWRRSWNA